MPLYKYRAIDESGKSLQGIIDAESQKTATEKLKREGFFLSSLKEVNQEKARSFLPFRGISSSELAITTRQFSTLISAGLPLESSLSALSEQAEDARLGQVLAHVKDRISEGSSLTNALKEHKNVFSDLYINIVKAGESSGTLDIVLLRLSDFLEKQAALKSRLQSALVYPIFMFIIGSGVLFFMITYIIPNIAKIFEESEKALPLITVILLNVCGFISQNIFAILIVLFATIFGVYRFSKTERGKEITDKLILRIPIFGKIATLVAISRFTRTLGTLLSSGIPLLEALDIGQAVVGNHVYVQALEDVREKVREGSSLASPLRQSGVFPPLVTRMINVGEQTGEMDNMLIKVSDIYELQVDTYVSALTSLLEPVMILVMGVVIGFIVFAILLPIFDLTSNLELLVYIIPRGNAELRSLVTLENTTRAS